MKTIKAVACRHCETDKSLQWKHANSELWWIHCDSCGNISAPGQNPTQAGNRWNEENMRDKLDKTAYEQVRKKYPEMTFAEYLEARVSAYQAIRREMKKKGHDLDHLTEEELTVLIKRALDDGGSGLGEWTDSNIPEESDDSGRTDQDAERPT